jgi:hypothetical protein
VSGQPEHHGSILLLAQFLYLNIEVSKFSKWFVPNSKHHSTNIAGEGVLK